MNIIKEIKQCYHTCPFFETDMDGMICVHPKVKDDGYAAMFITQDNSRQTFPERCPLRTEDLTITYKIKQA